MWDDVELVVESVESSELTNMLLQWLSKARHKERLPVWMREVSNPLLRLSTTSRLNLPPDLWPPAVEPLADPMGPQHDGQKMEFSRHRFAGQEWDSRMRLAALAASLTNADQALAVELAETALRAALVGGGPLVRLSGLVDVFASAGLWDKAIEAAASIDARTLDETIVEASGTAMAANVLADVGRRAALAGRFDKAENAVDATQQPWRAQGQLMLVERYVEAGLWDRAEVTLAAMQDEATGGATPIVTMNGVRMPHPLEQAEAAAELVVAGLLGVQLWDRAEVVARSIDDSEARGQALTKVVNAMSAHWQQMAPDRAWDWLRASAERLVAELMIEDSWVGSVPALGRLDPAAATAAADTMLRRIVIRA